MKELKKRLGITLLIMSTTFTAYSQIEWVVQPGYRVEFSGRGAEGAFSGLEGIIVFDSTDLDHSKLDVSIDPATISTGNKTKDKHARGDSWLDVKNFITIKFISVSIRENEESYLAVGKLILHGIEQDAQISFDFISNGTNQGMFKGEMMVNRSDFKIEGPLFSFMVGEEFEVTLMVPVKKKF